MSSAWLLGLVTRNWISNRGTCPSVGNTRRLSIVTLGGSKSVNVAQADTATRAITVNTARNTFHM